MEIKQEELILPTYFLVQNEQENRTMPSPEEGGCAHGHTFPKAGGTTNDVAGLLAQRV